MVLMRSHIDTSIRKKEDFAAQKYGQVEDLCIMIMSPRNFRMPPRARQEVGDMSKTKVPRRCESLSEIQALLGLAPEKANANEPCIFAKISRAEELLSRLSSLHGVGNAHFSCKARPIIHIPSLC